MRHLLAVALLGTMLAGASAAFADDNTSRSTVQPVVLSQTTHEDAQMSGEQQLPYPPSTSGGH